MLNIRISGKSVKSVFSATLLKVLFKQSVMTASYLIKHLCLREIRWICVFRHHGKSVSVSSQSCLQVLSLNIQVLKSVFSATLFKSFSVYEIHPSSQPLMHFFSFQRTSHHTRKRWILRILWSYGASSSYIFFFFFVLDNWFLQISWRHIASVEFKFLL